jgi:hypothetical protein
MRDTRQRRNVRWNKNQEKARQFQAMTQRGSAVKWCDWTTVRKTLTRSSPMYSVNTSVGHQSTGVPYVLKSDSDPSSVYMHVTTAVRSASLRLNAVGDANRLPASGSAELWMRDLVSSGNKSIIYRARKKFSRVCHQILALINRFSLLLLEA